MPTLHVCSLSRLEATATEIRAGHLVTLINVATPVARPAAIRAERHLFLGMNDIVEAQDGMVVPGTGHLSELLTFVRGWDAEHGRDAPLLIHCWAGVSRSTAAAYITACALHPDADEREFARRLRAASPSATPNARLVALADEALGRSGRMIEAIAAIGRGADCYEGTPFSLPLDA